MSRRTGFASAGMVWLSGCAWLALTQSRAPAAPASQPTQPTPQPGTERRAQAGLEGGAGNSSLGSFHCDRLWAMPNPTTWTWPNTGTARAQQRVCVCACVLSVWIFKDGTHNTFCEKIYNFIFVTLNLTKELQAATKMSSLSSNYVMAFASPWQHRSR